MFDPMDNLMDFWDKMNNYNHDNHYHNQRKYLSPFVLSVDGILGK